MGTGLSSNNPTIVSAFYNELFRQGLVVAVIVLFVAVAWSILRALQLRQASTGGPGATTSKPLPPEAGARRLLRVSFGLIWIFDGMLQAQASMPLGMAPQVIEPAAAASPGWVQHLDNALATIWSYHPVTAPAAAVWIQVGLGVWLLAASRGTWSRLGGVASVAWGMVVWIFGEAFGQVFAPGLSWLFGAPGAALLYCVAGALVALPEGTWSSPRLGRGILRATGLFWLGMSLLQAWPGRGFWQGQPNRAATPGSLTTMVRQMAAIPQPHLLASWVAAFGAFDAAHGWAVNLFAVVALALTGALLMAARPGLAKTAVVAGTVLCLADWVLVEDLGFMGGVGTDPNTMVPMVVLLGAGYLALTRFPAPEGALAAAGAAGRGPSWSELSWTERLAANPTYAFRSVAAIGAIAVVLVGTAPMAVAATDGHADPLLAQAVDGTPEAFDLPAPSINLTDQRGRPVSLAGLHGKALAVTFLDPVCTSDCPVIAQELREADNILGPRSKQVELVAIDANPRYIAPMYLQAFDRQENLGAVPNWLYLTGTLPELQHAWLALGATVQYLPGGAMVDHSEFAYVVDPRGRIRYDLDTDPGPATEATESSFAVSLAETLQKVLGPQ